MLQGILIIAFFLIIAALIITRKLPSFIALIIMAVGIPLIAGVPLVGTDADGVQIGILETVLGGGAMKMSAAIAAVIFGAWFGRMVTYTGVSRKLVKVAAELGGDRPLIVCLLLLAVLGVLWTSVTGIGATIMLGSIALPILISIGIPATMAACVYMLGIAIGFNFNLTQWSSFMNIFGCTQEEIRGFTSILFVVTSVMAVAFIFIEFKRFGLKYSFAAPAEETELNDGEDELIKGWRGVFCCLAPLVPLVLVVFLKFSIVPSFICGVIWLAVFSARGYTRTMNKVVKCAYDGIVDTAPAIFLFISVGILYTAVTNATVAQVLHPMLAAVVPQSRIGYILFFIILTPLVLYRGPMNLFGLGSGIAAVIASGGILPMMATMGAFVSMERMQCIGCPTNTQNIWVCNFVNLDVNVVTKRLLPYLWVMSGIGVIISSFLYL